MAIVKNIIFKINGEDYAMEIMRVNSIIRKQTVTPIPYAMPCVDGVIHRRDKVIPVYNLYKKFQIPVSEVTRETKWIITTIKGMQIAFQVDNVQEILQVNESAIVERPKIVEKDQTNYIKSIVNIEGKLVVILDIDNLLTIKEFEGVNQMMDEYLSE